MVEEQSSDREGLPEQLVETLADPATARSQTPYLLGVLDDGEPDHRLVAGTALCLVARSYPELREAVAERLLDRLDGDAHDEVGHALDYLATRYPETVEEAVETLEEDVGTGARERLSRSGAEGGFLRSESLAPGGRDRPVGRTQVAGEGDVDDPRQVYTADPADPDADVADHGDGEDDASEDAGGQDGDDRDADDRGRDGEDGDERDGDGDTTPGVTTVTLRAVSRRLSEIVERSKFDELTVLTEGRRDRYGAVYRTAGRLDGEEYAVGLTVYRLPEDHESFVAGFRTTAERWQEAGSHRAVLPVYDWNVHPRPWAAVEHTGESLATRSDPPSEPLWTVIELASGVAHAHQHGLVHGAIDPGNVRYRDAVLDDSRRQPLLSSPGIATLSETGPAGSAPGDTDSADERPRPGGLDPRYAAPEHYDDSYGRIDGSTDVYGLGALLFRLCTDHHPYTGDAGTVRGKVLSEGAPEPRRVNPDLPDSLHRVVRKATATRKLKRYETVTAFERELAQAREALLAEVDDA